MIQQNSGIEVQSVSGPIRQFDIFDGAIALGKERIFIAKVTTIATVVAFIVCLIWPKTYTARTVLLPPQNGQNTSGSVLATLGVLASTGLVGGTSLKSPEELYVSLLKSRTVADALIGQFDLQGRYGELTLTDTRRELGKRVSVAGEKKSGLVTVEVEDRDPKFSAELANAYADQLRHLMTRVAVTDAQQRRAYLEQQVQRAKQELSRAESGFQKAQEKSGLLSIDVSAQSAIRSAAELRARMTSLEIEIRSMSAYTAPGNPDLQRLGAELASLREQLVTVENGKGKVVELTADGLANVRAYRELKYQEAILGSMIAQLESARAEEAKEAPLVQQVDFAIVPDKKSQPKTVMIVSVVAVISLLVGCCISIFRHALRNGKFSDESDPRLRLLLHAWGIRK